MPISNQLKKIAKNVMQKSWQRKCDEKIKSIYFYYHVQKYSATTFFEWNIFRMDQHQI
jgi:hypothetical protein